MTAGAFRRAIADAGERVALLLDGEVLYFDGCVQPGVSVDVSASPGYGYRSVATLYAAADAVSRKLASGAEIRCAAGEFLVETVEDFSFGGEVVYRVARVTRVVR